MTRTQEYLTLFLNEIFNGHIREDMNSSLGHVIYTYSLYNKEFYYVFRLGDTTFFTNTNINNTSSRLRHFFDFFHYKWVFQNIDNKDWFYVKDNNYAVSISKEGEYYYFHNDENNGILYNNWESFKEFMSE